MIEPLVRIALVSAVAVLAGLPLVAPGRRPSAGDLAAAWTLALGNAAVLALAAGLLGLTLSPAALLVLLVAPGAAAAAALAGGRRRRGRRAPPESGGGREGDAAPPAADALRRRRRRGPASLVLVSRIALGCALVALMVKLALVPLWSWDHFAIWGVKARSMLAGGHLRLGFLRSLYQSRTDHPLGVPMAWLVLTLGEAPSPAVFKALHALFALALVAVTQAAVRRASSSTPLANAAAAFLAVSPLLWDSETEGLAEVPLALWAMVGLLLLPPAAASARHRAWVPGLALGFLPWIKQEGLVLGLLLLAAALALMLRARRGPPAANAATAGSATDGALLCGPALALMAGALAIQKLVLPPEVSFFIGDWWRRGVDRLPVVWDIQRQCFAFLLQPDWLGFWILLAASTLVALARRNGMALAVIAIVWIQVLIYELTALFSYLQPAAHLEAAFFRICAALVPLGLVGMAMLFRSPASGAAPGPSSRA